MNNRQPQTSEPHGRFLEEEGVGWYQIDGYDLLDPFLISVVSPDDQWTYISSSGALTAGRGSADHALFPYETDDRLHRSGGLTGPVTMIRATGTDDLWEPFAPWAKAGGRPRSLAKSAVGDRLRFEEVNGELGLTMRATWAPSGRFGLVRRCELINTGEEPVEVELLDGLVDVLPAGVGLADQQSASTLVDAYRRSEFDPQTGLGLFTLEALITDRADPAESLTANTIWLRGLDGATIAMSDRQVRSFRAGRALEAEHLATGRKGGLMASTTVTVHPGAPLRWMMACDGNQDHVQVGALRQQLCTLEDPEAAIDQAMDASSAELLSIVGETDGVQVTGDRRATLHHFASTLFNGMRGGVFLDDHRVNVAEVAAFVEARNRSAAQRFATATSDLEPVVELAELRAAVAGDSEADADSEADPDVVRLVSEYLPLTFSRRHGDPSRPWNRFNIPARGPDGGPAQGYEGNWRDIFQNWEALVHSFPGYAQSVVAKFLNASTLDGYNPYRITDRGVDWEQPEDGSWGNFGYWGDHQIVYLHRLLEAAERFHPGLLSSQLDARVFSSADVPYRIVSYDEMVADPKSTLVFDTAKQAKVDERVAAIGADGRLVPANDSNSSRTVYHATMAEKLLIPALAKLSNLVAGAGIWMNTQRPEWNDANNALVGNGVSTVTLFHLRDYLSFLDRLLASTTTELRISEPVLQWLADLVAAFDQHPSTIEASAAGDSDRRSLLDQLGAAFETYRTEVYASGPGSSSVVEPAQLRQLLAAATPHLNHAAETANRGDGLVHAYWLLRLEPGLAAIEPLPEMLEGQTAVLEASDTDAQAALELADALFESRLYRPDQQSFILYPNDAPPPFLEKNRLPAELVGPTVQALLERPGALVQRGVDGEVRFDSSLRSGRALKTAIDTALNAAVDADLGQNADPELVALLSGLGRAELTEAYEAVFNHRAFTGRSRTMYRYEGLGSIYWHMVSKLLQGLQEQLVEALEHETVDAELAARLTVQYHRVRAGLGFMKSVAEQGTFPTDPHSHTPAHGGAQQPGMTGQVKESVLIRWGELGVRVDEGAVRFGPLLIDQDEFLTEARPWAAIDGQLEAGMLGFTYCGVPVVYHLDDGEPWVSVRWSDGREVKSAGRDLDRQTSQALFERTGQLTRIDVGIA